MDKSSSSSLAFYHRRLRPCSLKENKAVTWTEEQVKNYYVFICYVFSGIKSDEVCWYTIDANNNVPGPNFPTLTPVCTIPTREIGTCFGTVTLGHKIYMIGGYLLGGGVEGSSYIFSFHTSSPLEWHKESAELLSKRGDPAVVAAHGKIYIFGSNEPMPDPWAEVFDPDSNICSALPAPPAQITDSGPYATMGTAVVAHGDQILLSIHFKYLFSFNVPTNTWVQINTELSLWCRRPMVIDDVGVMLSFTQGSLLAYDFVTHQWFADPVQGLDIVSMSAYPQDELWDGCVVNLGNNIFSVVWNDSNGYDLGALVRCVQFQVTRENNSPQAHILARSSYNITKGTIMVDCFPM